MCPRALMTFALFAVFAWSAAPAADDKTADHHAGAYSACAKACGDCQQMCDSCATHCANLVAQGKQEHLKTLRSCQDCASVCAAAAAITARQGPYAATICKACADVCARCAKACTALAQDDHMRKGAESCKNCEQACREMLGHLGAEAK